MIWKFEGGPWNGQELIVPDGMPLPLWQVIRPLKGAAVRYEIAEEISREFYIYRPKNEIPPQQRKRERFRSRSVAAALGRSDHED